MKTTLFAVLLLPAMAQAYCLFPAFTGNFQQDQMAQAGYQQCMDNERFQQQQTMLQRQQLDLQRQQLQQMQQLQNFNPQPWQNSISKPRNYIQSR